MAALRGGLDHVLSDVPVRSGFLEVVGGVTRQAGPFARLQGGYRPYRDVALFAAAEVNAHDAWAGVAGRWVF